MKLVDRPGESGRSSFGASVQKTGYGRVSRRMPRRSSGTRPGRRTSATPLRRTGAKRRASSDNSLPLHQLLEHDQPALN
jgi:hypothetical protein